MSRKCDKNGNCDHEGDTEGERDGGREESGKRDKVYIIAGRERERRIRRRVNKRREEELNT